jgi:hypothetical protein
MFDAHVLKVLIAAPGDTGDEVDAIMKSLHSWNGRRAEEIRVILLPRFWKFDAVPQLDPAGAQSVINTQLVDDADIVIAVFDSRLGQATEGAVSGTAHEIERTSEAGKPVHVYFSNEPVDRNVDPKELARLNEFRKELEGKGLLGVYSDPTDLGHQVWEAVEYDVAQMGLGVPQLPGAVGPQHAMPRGRREGDDLVIENKSQNVLADEFTFEYEGGCQILSGPREPIALLPQSEMRWGLAASWSGPPQVKLTMRWMEDGEWQQEVQTVAL